MIKFAKQFGIDAKGLGKILTDGGFSPFDPTRFSEMVNYIGENFVNLSQQAPVVEAVAEPVVE
jgi:hypothetical protein